MISGMNRSALSFRYRYCTTATDHELDGLLCLSANVTEYLDTFRERPFFPMQNGPHYPQRCPYTIYSLHS